MSAHGRNLGLSDASSRRLRNTAASFLAASEMQQPPLERRLRTVVQLVEPSIENPQVFPPYQPHIIQLSTLDLPALLMMGTDVNNLSDLQFA